MINSEIDEFFKNGVNTEVVQYDDTVEIEKKLIYAMSQVIGTRNEQQDRIAVKEKINSCWLLFAMAWVAYQVDKLQVNMLWSS